MANLNVGDLVVTTMRHYSKTVVDNVTNNNALLYYLNKNGAIKEKANGGREIDEYISWGNNTSAQFYDGYDTFNPPTDDQNVIDVAQFNWKQQGGFVSISGKEEAMNAGEYELKNLLQARITQLDEVLQNQFAVSLYSNGTGSGGKELTGLQAMIADTPTSGTYGGINSATNAFWRNYTSGTQTITSSNVQSFMNLAWLNTIRGKDVPDLILSDYTLYNAYWTSLQALQRITESTTGEAGFTSLKFQNADVVADYNCTAKRMYFVNTKHVTFTYAPNRWFQVGKQRTIQNADYIVVPMFTMGNFTCKRRASHGVVIDD